MFPKCILPFYPSLSLPTFESAFISGTAPYRTLMTSSSLEISRSLLELPFGMIMLIISDGTAGLTLANRLTEVGNQNCFGVGSRI